MSHLAKSIMALVMTIPSIVFAQETKKVTKRHYKPKYTECFYVLVSNDTVKHGSYEKRGYEWSCKGHYKFGRMDSVWTYYGSHGKKECEGIYCRDTLRGTWIFYDFDGEVEQKFNFDSNQLVYFISHEIDKEFKVINGTDTLKTILERPPLYFGGIAALARVLQNTIQYPMDAMVNGISGKVFVSFILDKNGKTSNYRVIKSVGYGCDEEALRVLKLLSNNWIPALHNGQTATTEYVIPISFKIQ
jgi:TonB family protein